MSKTVLFALLLSVALTSMALAKRPEPLPDPAPEPEVSVVQAGATTTVSVIVKNADRKTQLPGILNLRGTDENGALVANMGRPVVVYPKSGEQVDFTWQAPAYPTALSWKAKVVPFREDPIDHSFGWLYPKLQHRLTAEAKNPNTCQQCHTIDYQESDQDNSCYSCHGHHWN